jgi:hypothetical protein
MSPPTATDQFVLDGSVTLAWLFHDEQDPYADAIVARLPDIEMHARNYKTPTFRENETTRHSPSARKLHKRQDTQLPRRAGA